MQIKFGRISLDAPFFQAALSGYSDRPMRTISRRYGAGLTFCPVMLDKAALHPKARRKANFAFSDDEHPIGAQLLGSDPQTMAQAAQVLEGMGFDLIDLNFACPAPKVLRRGRGGAFLTKPSEAIAVYRSVRDAVTCPVLVKLRISYDDPPRDREAFWHICESVVSDGIDGLIVHGRGVLQRFRGKADWEVLAELKRRFSGTTIIGSGDLFTAANAVDRLRSTGIDGVVIARGAIGNPWIFGEMRSLLDNNFDATPPDLAEQGEVMLDHWRMVLETYTPRKGIPYFRKFAVRYCRRHPRRKWAQAELLAADTADEVAAAIKHWYCDFTDKGDSHDSGSDRTQSKLSAL